MQQFWLSIRRNKEKQQRKGNDHFISQKVQSGSKGLSKNMNISRHLASLAPLLRKGERRMWQRTIDTCHIAPIGSTWTSWMGRFGCFSHSLLCLQSNSLHPTFRHFVPNLTIGAPVIESLRKHTTAYLDCHLMVTNPLDYVDPMGKAGASGFTFHVEVSKENWQELVQKIKAKGMRPGVALKPGTPIEEVYPLVEGENPVEMVLVMTVEPGFGGQKFMPETMEKVRVLRKKYPSLDIEVDGGLGPSTIDVAASAGANCIVAGSSVFGASEPGQVISLLRKSVQGAQQNN
nr:ribulose-phosphate 3-epimerase, cytoplasmic isoform [Quercus suber]